MMAWWLVRWHGNSWMNGRLHNNNDTTARTRWQGRDGKDAMARTRRRGRDGEDAMARTRRPGRDGKDATAMMQLWQQ